MGNSSRSGSATHTVDISVTGYKVVAQKPSKPQAPAGANVVIPAPLPPSRK